MRITCTIRYLLYCFPFALAESAATGDAGIHGNEELVPMLQFNHTDRDYLQINAGNCVATTTTTCDVTSASGCQQQLTADNSRHTAGFLSSNTHRTSASAAGGGGGGGQGHDGSSASGFVHHARRRSSAAVGKYKFVYFINNVQNYICSSK